MKYAYEGPRSNPLISIQSLGSVLGSNGFLYAARKSKDISQDTRIPGKFKKKIRLTFAWCGKGMPYLVP